MTQIQMIIGIIELCVAILFVIAYGVLRFMIVELKQENERDLKYLNETKETLKESERLFEEAEKSLIEAKQTSIETDNLLRELRKWQTEDVNNG